MICSGCQLQSNKPEGSYSTCCKAIVVSQLQMAMAERGKIPTIAMRDSDSKPREVKKNVDSGCGIRKGTKKYNVYQMWRIGKSNAQIVRKLKVNSSSVRSWTMVFRRKYEYNQ